jgi:hypothetical protein
LCFQRGKCVVVSLSLSVCVLSDDRCWSGVYGWQWHFEKRSFFYSILFLIYVCIYKSFECLHYTYSSLLFAVCCSVCIFCMWVFFFVCTIHFRILYSLVSFSLFLLCFFVTVVSFDFLFVNVIKVWLQSLDLFVQSKFCFCWTWFWFVTLSIFGCLYLFVLSISSFFSISISISFLLSFSLPLCLSLYIYLSLIDWMSNDFCDTVIWCDITCVLRGRQYVYSLLLFLMSMLMCMCIFIFACLFLYKPLFLCFFFFLQLQLLLQITPSQPHTQTITKHKQEHRRHDDIVCLFGLIFFLLIFVLFC